MQAYVLCLFSSLICVHWDVTDKIIFKLREFKLGHVVVTIHSEPSLTCIKSIAKPFDLIYISHFLSEEHKIDDLLIFFQYYAQCVYDV